MLLSITCASLMFLALVGWLYPRLTTHLDRRLTVPRLVQPLIHDQRDSPKDSFAVADPRISTSVEMVEELIRHARSGVHARDVLSEVFAQHTSLSSHFTSATHTHTTSISEILLTCAQSCETAQQHDDAHMCRMLKASFVHGVFVPGALEHVVTTLRTRHAIRADIRTASAQAMFTVRILTHLPIVAFAILLLSSSDMRGRIFHLSTLIVLSLGLFLNRLGAWWIHILIAHTVNRPVDETIALAEQLAASLRAGCSLTESLHAWEDVTPAGTTVAHAIMRGERLENALHHLPQTTAGYRLAHTILSAHKDGLPFVNTVHRLMSDAHNDMRHATETLIRQLPGRLSAPVVLCILPSFLIIAVVPLLVHSLGQLGPALSPALTAVS
jgi:Flp pilus assembly protein TadB